MRSQYVLPIAIVVAGALIAGAIFLLGASSTPATPGSGSITVRPYDPASDHILGNPGAPIKVIEYLDLECPHCKIFEGTMHQIMAYYGSGGKVAWVSRPFPLGSIHDRAPKEAEAAECAAQLGGNTAYWSYVDKVFEVTPSDNGLDPAQLPVIAGQVGLNVDAFKSCLSSGTFTKKIEASYNEAIGEGGNGTPYILVTLNDQLVPGSNLSGAQEYDSMRAIIDELLKQLPSGTATTTP